MYRAQAQTEELLQQSSATSDVQHQNHAHQVLMKESQERRSLQTLWWDEIYRDVIRVGVRGNLMAIKGYQ